MVLHLLIQWMMPHPYFSCKFIILLQKFFVNNPSLEPFHVLLPTSNITFPYVYSIANSTCFVNGYCELPTAYRGGGIFAAFQLKVEAVRATGHSRETNRIMHTKRKQSIIRTIPRATTNKHTI